MGKDQTPLALGLTRQIHFFFHFFHPGEVLTISPCSRPEENTFNKFKALLTGSCPQSLWKVDFSYFTGRSAGLGAEAFAAARPGVKPAPHRDPALLGPRSPASNFQPRNTHGCHFFLFKNKLPVCGVVFHGAE